MFEKATREKIRFPYKGNISVEDLWDLGVKELDSIYKTLNSKMKTVKEDSLLNCVGSKEDKELELQISIIKHIVDVKLQEMDAAKKARERKEQRQKILEVLASKKDDALKSKTIEELEAMYKETE